MPGNVISAPALSMVRRGKATTGEPCSCVTLIRLPSHLANEWSAQGALPFIAVALLPILLLLRLVVPGSEGGRVKAGIFFAGAYLLSLVAISVFHPPLPQ